MNSLSAFALETHKSAARDAGELVMICEYHDNIGSLQGKFDGEIGRAVQVSPFDRPEWWQNLWEKCLANSDRTASPSILSVHDNRGNSLWLPMVRARHRHLTSLANWYNFSWRPVFSGAPGEQAKLALLAEAARKISRSHWRATFAPLPDEDDSASLMERAFRHAGWCVWRHRCDHNHVLKVKGRTFDEYWQARPGQLRSTVKRKTKKNAVSLRIDTVFSEQVWADYESIYARSWKPEEGNPDFLKDWARRESSAGTLRLGIAYAEGLPAAAQFWTVEHGEALIHKLAHDERFLKLSPGTLLSTALFQHVIDNDKVELVDFGTGNDRYKQDWMEEDRHRYQLEMAWPHNPLSWPYAMKRRISALVASTMRR